MFLVLSRAWDKEKSLSHHDESNGLFAFSSAAFSLGMHRNQSKASCQNLRTRLNRWQWACKTRGSSNILRDWFPAQRSNKKRWDKHSLRARRWFYGNQISNQTSNFFLPTLPPFNITLSSQFTEIEMSDEPVEVNGNDCFLFIYPSKPDPRVIYFKIVNITDFRNSVINTSYSLISSVLQQ